MSREIKKVKHKGIQRVAKNKTYMVSKDFCSSRKEAREYAIRFAKRLEEEEGEPFVVLDGEKFREKTSHCWIFDIHNHLSLLQFIGE